MLRGIDTMKEFLGMGESNPDAIEAFLRRQSRNGDLNIDITEIPWCSAMMNGCERSVDHASTGSLAARSWLGLPEHVDIRSAEEGDICIWDFEHDGTHGHVTYFVSESEGEVRCLGGNQSQSVKYSVYDVRNLVGIRRNS